MKHEYIVHFKGNVIGALGLDTSLKVRVIASDTPLDDDAVILKLYDTHEHIHFIKINGRIVRGNWKGWMNGTPEPKD